MWCSTLFCFARILWIVIKDDLALMIIANISCNVKNDIKIRLWNFIEVTEAHLAVWLT